MAYNGKGVDSNDIARQKASAMEAINIAKKSSDSTRKMFGGNSTRIAGDTKARSNKTAIMKEQQMEYQTIARNDVATDSMDPYKFESPAKLKAVDKLALREQGYTNTLLTQIIKNQNNTESIRAEAQFRDGVLSLLKEIRDNTKKEQKKTDLTSGKSFESKTRKSSDLVEAIFGGKPKEIIKQLVKSTDMGMLGLDGFGMIKDALDGFKEPGALKQMMIDKVLTASVNAIPIKDLRDHLSRFRANASEYVQDIINQLAFGKNATLRAVTQAHHQAIGYDPSTNKRTDMSKEALFDNKFYTTVTFEIPSILYSIRDGINKYVGERYDYDRQEWTSLQEQIRDMAQSSQTITTGVDQMMRNFSLMSEKAIANTGGISNSNMSQLFDTDKFGAYTKDKNGRLKFQNEILVRQVMAALLKAKVDSNSFMNVEPTTLINKLGLKSKIAKEYHAILPNIILGLSDVFNNVDWTERKDWDDRRENIINATERNYVSNKEKLSSYAPSYVSAMYKFEKGIINAREFEELTGSSIYRTGIGNGRGGGGGNSGGGGSGSKAKKKSKVNNRVKPQSNIKSTKDLYNILRSPTVSVDTLINIPESVWNELPEDTKREVNNMIAKATFGMTSTRMMDNLISNDIASDIRNMTAEQKEEALRMQKSQAIKSMINNGGITDKGLRERYYSNTLTADDQAKLDIELKKYFKANEYFSKMNNANMTAASMANYVGMETKASDMERLGFIKDPAQLVPFIDDNGNLDIAKLKVRYSKYTEAMMQSIEKRDRIARGGQGFEASAPIDSFNKVLSNIFSDPKITRVTGVMGGAGVGLAVGKLLQEKGVVQSPLLGTLLASVMSGAMLFSRTREKMEAVLGPEGEYKNQDGITNRQIFMAKFLNKWLPSIGLGGKVGSMTMRAFQAMGPIGAAISPLMGLTTGLIAGAMAPSLLRFAQRRLFDDDGKGNKGMLKKVGNFLKKFEFIRKYFSIKDKRSDSEVRHDVVSAMIKSLEEDSRRLYEAYDNPQTSEEEKTQALAKIAENEKRIMELKSFDEDLTAIEEDQQKTDEQKKEARERRKEILGDKNKEAFGLREMSELKKRDLSKSGVAMHDMKFMTKQDMYEATASDFFHNKIESIRSGKLDIAEAYMKGVETGDFSGIQDENLLANLHDAYNHLSPEDKKKRETVAFVLSDRAATSEVNKFISDEYAIRELMYDENGKLRSNFRVAELIASDYINQAFEKHTYDRAIKNGKVLLPNQVVGTMAMQDFNSIMQNQDLTPEQKEQAIKEWYEKLPQDKKEALDDVVNLRLAMQESYSRSVDLYSMYLSMVRPELAKDEAMLLRNAIYGIREAVTVNNYIYDVLNAKNIAADSFKRLMYTTIEGGYIVNDNRAKGQSEQVISQLMNMRYNEEAGGAGGSNEVDTQTGWRMDDFKDIKFANGKRVSVAGCALGAFNAAIIRHGYPPISASTMVDVANDFLTDDGVNMDFFKAMATKIDWACMQYKGSENVFTPQNIKSILTDPKSSAILQLKNIDNDGSHYVTLLTYGTKKCQICDPEATVYKTDILTGDILARLISITVLTKPNNVGLKEGSDKSLKSKIKKIKEGAKEGFKKGLKSTMLGAAVFGVAQLAKAGYKKYKGGSALIASTDTTPTNDDGTTPSVEEQKDTQDPVVAKLQEILDKLNDFVNVRIIGDDTIALTNTDLESSKSALLMSQQDAKDPKAKMRIQRIRQLFNKPSFQKDQLKKEMVEDALLKGNTTSIINNIAKDTPAAKDSGSWWDKLKGFLGGLLGSGLSSILGFFKGAFAGLLGDAIIAGLKTLGIFGLLIGASELIGWLAEKLTGLKKDDMKKMGIQNDLGTTENVDMNGLTKKQATESYMRNAKQSYVTTPEWIAFAEEMNQKGYSSKDSSKYVGEKSVVMQRIYEKYSNIDLTKDKNELNIPYIMKKRDNMAKTFQAKWDKENPDYSKTRKYDKTKKKFTYSNIAGLNDMDFSGEKGDGPSSNYKRYNYGRLMATKVSKFKYGSYPAINNALGIVQNAAAAAFGGGKFGLTMGEGAGLQGDFSRITNGNSDPIAIISKVAQITGVDENLMMAIAGKESGFVADAGASGSSAKGLFQFTTATWKDTTKKHARKIGLTPEEMQRGLGTSQDPRFNPYMNAFMGAFHLADEYALAKKYAGRDPLPEEVYMVHAFGFGGSKKYIQGSKDALGIQLETSQSVINANPYFFYEGGKKRIRPFTVGEMYNWFRNGLESGLKVRNKKSGTSISYSGAFGISTGGDAIYKPANIDPTIKLGESIGKTYAGIMHNMPIKGTRSNVVVTSAFGPRNVKGGSRDHKGIDIRAYKGTPIFATHDGRITSNTSNFGIVQITGDNGMSTRYLHLSRRTPLKIGDFVKAGQQIGEAGGVGPNGRIDAYGSHLHYEVIDANGNKIDPFKVLELTYDNLKHTERENIAYAQRNNLSGRRLDKDPAGLEKGDGPVNHSAAPTQVVTTSNDGMLAQMMNTMIKFMSSMIAAQKQTTEAVVGLTKMLQSESRNNSLMSGAKIIAKSRI